MNVPIDVNVIRARRIELGWTQEKLAEASGLSKRAVEGMMSRGTAAIESVRRIAKAFNVDVTVVLLAPPAGKTPDPRPRELVKLAPSRILRPSPPILFGREKWLDALDVAWAKPHLNVYTLVAWGGVGKTSLVAHWVGVRIAAKGWPGVERYFDWSFYSQGTGESRQTSSDVFIQDALTFFDDPDPIKGSPWERGERLAGLIRKHRTLLVLDGLEPLQYPVNDPQAGRLKDQALEALLQGLAADNPGLCVVTTREHLKNIESLKATTEEQKLDTLVKDAAVALLRYLQVVGTEEEMEAAWKEGGGHALTLQLLGRFIADAYEDRDVRHFREVRFEDADREHQGRSAFKVMVAYERWLASAGPVRQRELAVLRLTGLFDRPMSRECLDALRAEPAIPGLTDALVGMKEREWTVALNRLSDVDLLSVTADAVDAHPLIREYFAAQLKKDLPKAFKAAHSRLFDHLRKTKPNKPDTLEGLQPLYEAVSHGCQAGRYKDAWDLVYMPRILREPRVSYATRELGLFGHDLAALAGFFESPWDKPVQGLSERRLAFLFALVGSRLRALGRLHEAVAPMRRSLTMHERQERFEWAAHKARHLAELQHARGDLPRALDAAKKGVDLADRSNIAYERYAERAVLGSILHHLGKPAAEAFIEAERILREDANYKHLHQLYSLWGYRYCDFLIDQGKAAEAHDRGLWMQQMTKNGLTRQDPENGLGLISVGLEWLVLGRVGLHRLKSRQEVDSASVRAHLDHAIYELRRAGRADFIPLGYISRAAFRRLTGNALGARTDLESALAVIDRSGMKVHKVDYLLELARLESIAARRPHAEHALREARTLIEKIGYEGKMRELDALESEILRDYKADGETNTPVDLRKRRAFVHVTDVTQGLDGRVLTVLIPRWREGETITLNEEKVAPSIRPLLKKGTVLIASVNTEVRSSRDLVFYDFEVVPPEDLTDESP